MHFLFVYLSFIIQVKTIYIIYMILYMKNVLYQLFFEKSAIEWQSLLSLIIVECSIEFFFWNLTKNRWVGYKIFVKGELIW